MCFLWISEQTAIISLYKIKWLVFITEMECVYCAVRIEFSFKAQWLLYVAPSLTFTNSVSCPHSVFMCFVWISEQTAIVSLHSSNWPVLITKVECLLVKHGCAILYYYIYIYCFNQTRNILDYWYHYVCTPVVTYLIAVSFVGNFGSSFLKMAR
jgi:hypothetical protein